MFTVTKPAQNRVDIRLKGSIDSDIMRDALDDLIAKSEGVTNGRMLYTITDFEMPTLGAIGVEFARLPRLFGLLGKFDRCAVIADAGWLRKAAEIEGAIIPGIEIRSFEPMDIAAAEVWLGKDPV